MANAKNFSISSYPTNIVVGIALVAGFFSFFDIGHKSIWLDEAASILFAKLQWGDFWVVLLGSELNQGLYYLLLKFWILVFGDSEFAVRALSALFSIASIPVLYALASRFFGTRAGLTSASLASVNAFLVQYAQEARGYSLVFLLAALSSYLFVRVIENPSNKKVLCGYVCISALSVYAHFFGAWVLIAQTLSVPFLPSDKFRFRHLVLADIVIAVLLIPVVLFVLFKDQGQLSWLTKPNLSSLKVLLHDLAGDAGHSGFITGFYLLPCAITLAHAFVALFKNGRSVDTWHYALIVLLLAVPVGFTYGLSFLKPIFVNRYLIVSLPGLVLLSGVGIALIKDKYCYPILLLLLVVLSIRSTLTDYYPREKENFRDTASYVVSHAQRGDGILFYKGFVAVPFEYYWRRLNPPLDLLDSVHPWKLGRFNWLKGSPDLPVSYLESLKDRYERIWLVKSHVFGERSIVFSSILTTLEKDYQLQREKSYEGIRVFLFIRK